jgi:YD repeat-containing protein
MMRCKLYILALGLLAPALHAQFLLNDVSPGDLGMPPNAQLILCLGLMGAGKMANDSSIVPKGPVAEVTWEEFREGLDGTPIPNDVSHSIKKWFSEQGLVTQEDDFQGMSHSITTFQHQGSRLIGEETVVFNPARPDIPKMWSYWKYDASGKLADFTDGRGQTLELHYENFKRDQKGRMVSFDYRRGPNDILETHTELEYSTDGQTVREATFDETNTLFETRIKTLDNAGRVARLEIHETTWPARLPSRTIRVAFKYDEQGRLVEQDTEPYKVESDGGEQEIPPGKIHLTYDDGQHTRTMSYEGEEGPITSTVALDVTGALIRSGFKTAEQSYDSRLEFTYDDHGNWITCKQWVTAEGTRKMTGLWRRTIAYR